uniref:Uncharacterized protein n=1 Tax=Spirodela intermedia TaxID=51605 RepID=A0A8S0Y7B0_SPIIN
MKTRFRYGSELTVSCSISLPDGGSFHLSSRYYFAIGHPGVFSLARWSLLIHTGFHVPHATRVRAVQYSTASPSSTTLVLLSHNPVFTV